MPTRHILAALALLFLFGAPAAPAAAQWLRVACSQPMLDQGLCPALGERGLLITYWISDEPVSCDAAAVAAKRCRPERLGAQLATEAQRTVRALSRGFGWEPGLTCDEDLKAQEFCGPAEVGQSIPAAAWAAESLGQLCIDEQVRRFDQFLEDSARPIRGSPRRP